MLQLFSAPKLGKLGSLLDRAFNQNLGDRILAIKVEPLDTNDKQFSILAVSAYAPIEAAKESICQDFATEIEPCTKASKFNEVLLVCMDANTSVGSRIDKHDQVLGPFGVNYTNVVGRALHDFLDTKGIYSATTLFQKQTIAT